MENRIKILLFVLWCFYWFIMGIGYNGMIFGSGYVFGFFVLVFYIKDGER